MVNKLTADVTDLKLIIVAKDTTIHRLNESVRVLSLNGQPDRRPTTQPKVMLPARPPTPRREFWPRAENWGWRGLFLYLGVQAVRSAINN